MTAWPTREQFFAAYHAAADPEPTRAEVMAEVWHREREAVWTLAGQLWPTPQPVAFADVWAGRAPIIVSPETPPDTLTFGCFVFDRGGGLYWPGEVALAVDPAARVWPWTIETPQAGDPHFPRAVSWSTFDDEVGYWPDAEGFPLIPGGVIRSMSSPAEDVIQWLRRSDDYWRQRANDAMRDVMRSAPFLGMEPGFHEAQAIEANADDLVRTLIEFARAGQREEFDFLASASGVTEERREELWTGTRKRLGLT